jgi:hypothetical protein
MHSDCYNFLCVGWGASLNMVSMYVKAHAILHGWEGQFVTEDGQNTYIMCPQLLGANTEQTHV